MFSCFCGSMLLRASWKLPESFLKTSWESCIYVPSMFGIQCAVSDFLEIIIQSWAKTVVHARWSSKWEVQVYTFTSQWEHGRKCCRTKTGHVQKNGTCVFSQAEWWYLASATQKQYMRKITTWKQDMRNMDTKNSTWGNMTPKNSTCGKMTFRK